MGKKLSDSQIATLVQKKKTAVLKGFVLGGAKKDGFLKLTDMFNVEFEEAVVKITKIKKSAKAETQPSICPVCKKGTVLKGKTAYGCSEYKSGCTFRLPFVG